ncbi:MAG TPA: energy transducer TonB [Candidatus Eremiobacteraceae bacterium]|nr:energy transducer TonB [Candidatus Eremiobacteraceae bacterium]
MKKIIPTKNRIVAVLLALLAVCLFVPISASAQQAAEANRKLVSKTVPQYPGLCRPLRIQGNVRADVLVAPNGKVKSLEVKGGHPLLVQSAEDALRQWKWEPASHETHEIVELKFTP